MSPTPSYEGGQCTHTGGGEEVAAVETDKVIRVCQNIRATRDGCVAVATP